MEKWISYILARKAYEAYHDYLDNTVGKGYFGMDKARAYDEISNESRNAWISVVEEVLKSYPDVIELGEEVK